MKRMPRLGSSALWPLVAGGMLAAACHRAPDVPPTRASGYVEATDVRVAPEVGGRLLDVAVAEGDRVAAGDVIARIDTADAELTLRRVQAERDQAQAQLALLQAGSRAEDIRQAQSQQQAAQNDVKAAQADADAATADVQRFEHLLQANAGSVKQRDDAVTRRDVALARVRAAQDRARATADAVARLKSGARPQEIAGARARVAALDAPAGGVVTSKILHTGEMAAPRAPIVVVTDLDHAWANVYVDERLVPQLKIGQTAALITDAGQRLSGTITFISPKAEFTPRNVQTAEERSKLVYRIKVTADNRAGVLKPGMPVEADLSPGQQ